MRLDVPFRLMPAALQSLRCPTCGKVSAKGRYEVWGQRLRDLRLDRGLSQDALAGASGGRIDQTAISRWERGGPIPDDAKIRVARALGVDASDLFPLEDLAAALAAGTDDDSEAA